jgi:hypothetical protein
MTFKNMKRIHFTLPNPPQRAMRHQSFCAKSILLTLRVSSSQPFNAFLSGFGATVGQFVLTASLRIQTNPANEKDFDISHER